MLKFKFISFSQITGALLRVLAGVILVLLGFKVFGAVWGSFFSFFSIYILGFIPLRFLFRKTKDKEVTVNIREFAKYAIPSTITILSLSSFISVDVILVKHFFPPLQAGLYGGLSLIGKVIFYFTGPIPIALFPLVVKRHLKNENYKKLFLLALLLVLLPSVAISAFYLIYPLFTTQLFLGDEYVAIVPYLGLFGIYIGAFSLLNVSVSFYLSLKKNLIFIPVLLGSILQIILITLFHANFYEIIFVSLGIVGLLLFGFLLSFLKSFKL